MMARASTPLLRLLDTPHVQMPGARAALPLNVPGLLIAHLAIQGEWVARERVSTLLWPDASEVDAQHHLRITLHRSRQVLAGWGLPDALVSERRRVRLELACDVPQFREAMGRADWATAVALHRAPLLDGHAIKGFAALDEWLGLERDALVTAWRNAALRQAAQCEARGDALGAAELLHAQLRHDLLAEDTVQALLRVAPAAGERSTALETFERFRLRLQDELGLDPMPGTLALVAALRSSPPANARAASPMLAAVPTRPALPELLLLPPLMGRQVELTRLAAAPPGLLVVAGEPGVGKSRLLAEALDSAAVAASGSGVLWLRCRDGLQSAPLLPLLQALATRLEQVRAAVPEPAKRRLLARLLPELLPGEVLGPPETDSPRLLASLAELLPRLSTVVVIDDLQWADAATLTVLRLCLGGTPTPCWFASLRPAEASGDVQGFIDQQDADGRLSRIDLTPLPDTAVADLLQRLSGAAAPRFAAWLHARSGGNPFFALETLRALFDSGQLRAEPGGAQHWVSDLDALSTDYRELQVPPRVAALVRRRVDGLTDATRRVLAIAAVAGDAQWLEPLAQVAGLSPWAMAEALAAAQAAGLLKGRSFAHDLVREALLHATPEALQVVLHAGIARHCAEHLTPHRLAQHWWAAGETAAALEATERAAQHDQLRGLHSSANDLLRRAQSRCSHAAQRAQLVALRARLALEIGDFQASQALAQQALDSLPTNDTHVRALLVQADLALLQGQLDEAERLQARAVEIDPAIADLSEMATKIAHGRNRFEEVVRLSTERITHLRRLPPGPELITALTNLGSGHDGAGRFEQASRCHSEALQIARQIGARYAEVETALNLLVSLPELGRRDEAIALGEATLALGDYATTPYLLNNLAWLYYDSQRTDEAMRLYQRLATQDEPTLRCYAWAKLVVIHARAKRSKDCRTAIEAGFAAMPATELYGAHAVMLEAVLLHGRKADLPRVKRWLRAEPLESLMQQRLEAALGRHGMEMPA